MSSTDTYTTPLSKLRAVNFMLGAVRGSKVDTLLAADTNEDAQDALRLLAEASAEVQQAEWHFNTEYDYPIDPDGNGYIHLPANATSVSVAARSRAIDMVQRGTRMYNLTDHTYVFPGTVYVDIRFILEFDEIPPPVAWFILNKAGQRFVFQRNPDAAQLRFTQKELELSEAAAWSWNQKSSGAILPEVNRHHNNWRRSRWT